MATIVSMLPARSEKGCTSDREDSGLSFGIIKNGDFYSTFAPAKLNIRLFIGKTEVGTGLHVTETTMQTISLRDFVLLRKVEGGKGEVDGCENIKDNIATRTIGLLSDYVNRELGCRITIVKKIPDSAGMGGGSSDAAAVLRLANKAFGLGLGTKELEVVGRRVGNDVAFLLYGGRAELKGGREQMITKKAFEKLYYVTATPNMKLSTAGMYEEHDKTGKNFTQLASEKCADTARLLEELRKDPNDPQAPKEAGLTGKGPTVFAGYAKEEDAIGAAAKLGWLEGSVFVSIGTEPLPQR
jgi:4-diphosphocytidyl-2C-methyl-D-erythritol kinase